MRKLIALTAVFLAVFAVNANAGDLTVANTDLTLAGGISATYNYVSDTRTGIAGRTTDDHDYFSVDTAVVHLLKNPTVDSPVGGHLAFASFDVKLVTGQVLSPTFADYNGNTENFRLWLGYFSYMPIENLTVDAGLLWAKFGEPPLTILNPHVTRPVAFFAQPVCFGGARISYDAGVAKLYVGTNDGSALGQAHGNKDGIVISANGKTQDSDRAYEVGASANVEALNIGVHHFNHDQGYNTTNGSVGVNAGMLSAKVEVNYVQADTKNQTAALVKYDDDDAITWALYACAKLTDNFKVPVRVEFVDDMNSNIYAGYDGYSVAVTPTFNPTPNSFIRVEGVYVEDNNDREDNPNKFRDSRGRANQRDDRHAVIAEFGFLF